MVGAKGFYFRTPGFQYATTTIIGLVCLSVGLGAWSGCARSARVSRSHNAGLIVVETTGHSSEDLKAIAQALLREMRHDRLRVDFYPHHYAFPGATSALRLDTGSRAATKTLQRAWGAYYEMRLDEASQMVGSEIKEFPVNNPDGVRARLLAALIHFAAQEPSKARSLLREVPRYWPSLDLSGTQYPPKFISFYERVALSAKKQVSENLVLAAHRPLTALRRRTVRVAEARRWRQVWLLRVIPQGGRSRAELQRVNEKGRFTQYRSVRFGPQAQPEKIAGMLWEGRAAI